MRLRGWSTSRLPGSSLGKPFNTLVIQAKGTSAHWPVIKVTGRAIYILSNRCVANPLRFLNRGTSLERPAGRRSPAPRRAG
jgi:hypothetical protein